MNEKGHGQLDILKKKLSWLVVKVWLSGPCLGAGREDICVGLLINVVTIGSKLILMRQAPWGLKTGLMVVYCLRIFCVYKHKYKLKKGKEVI